MTVPIHPEVIDELACLKPSAPTDTGPLSTQSDRQLDQHVRDNSDRIQSF